MPTVAVSGVLPPGGTTVNQFPPEVVETPVVTVPFRVAVLVTVTGCVAGSAPFTVKLSDVGLAANVGVGGGVTMGVRVNMLLNVVPKLVPTPTTYTLTVPTLVKGGVHWMVHDEAVADWRRYWMAGVPAVISSLLVPAVRVPAWA